MTARKLINIEGRQLPYDQGMWAVYDTQHHPVGSMICSARTGDDPVKAAREFWGTASIALEHLARGYRIELMTRARWKAEVAPVMLADAEKAAGGDQ